MRFLLAILFSASTFAAAPWMDHVNESAWTPPVGIPMPSFGITNSHWIYHPDLGSKTYNYGAGAVPYRTNEFGPYTYYVDPDAPGAMDGTNTYGTPATPRLTFPYPLIPGDVVQLGGGNYDFNNASGTPSGSFMAWGGPGTAENPIFFTPATTSTNLADLPVVTKSTQQGTVWWGDYTIVQGIRTTNNCTTSTRPNFKNGKISYYALRYIYARGSGTTSGSSWFGVGGSSGSTTNNYTQDFVILKCNVAYFGDWQAGSENDRCGMIMSEHATNNWILDSEIFRNGGDSVRIGADSGGTPTGGNNYIGRNLMWGNRENAVDVKQARGAVISENVMHTFVESTTSGGTVLAIHYAPQRVWMINNMITNATRGIASTGTSTIETNGCVVMGNVLIDILEHGLYLNSGGGWFDVVNNTVYGSTNNYYTSQSLTGIRFANNISAERLGSSGYHLGVSANTVANGAYATNFIFHQTSGGTRILWDGATYTSAASWISGEGTGNGSTDANPLFVNAANNNLSLQAGSPAIGASVSIASLVNRFQSEWGRSLEMVDINGTARPSGGVGWSIGAYEVASGTNPEIGVTPASLSFGSVTIGNSSDLNFTVQNTGTGNLSWAVSGIDAPFSVIGTGSGSLGAGATATVTIRFTPTVAGAASDTASFTGGSGASRNVTGTGVAPPSVDQTGIRAATANVGTLTIR